MQRILVVDDVEVNRELLRNMLEKDYIVEMAEDGVHAVHSLEEHCGEIAAVLLDLQMPGMDGFAVMEEMRHRGWMPRIPVLIISGEFAIEVENRCFELGVCDFIHKPFEGSIVRNRIRNTMELFSRRNQLERKVKEQEEIIRIHAEKLREERSFNRLMMEYRSAIKEVETKLQVLNEEFSQEYNRNPFESIKSRLKSPDSIFEKLRRKGFPLTLDAIRENLSDVAGVRVICSFPDDIYRLAALLTEQDDIILIQAKDYIEHPKANGYRSLHYILDVPIFLSHEKKYMNVEVQFRTIAMDFWASLEHKLRYKKNWDRADADEIVAQLKSCADSIEDLDYQMQTIRDKIERCSQGLRKENDRYENKE